MLNRADSRSQFGECGETLQKKGNTVMKKKKHTLESIFQDLEENLRKLAFSRPYNNTKARKEKQQSESVVG